MTDVKEKVKERFGFLEITDKRGQLWKAAFAEFLGNVLLNFFGCASCIYISDPTALVSLTRIAFTFGVLIFVLILAIGHISGGHLNPAVSIAFLLLGKITIIRGFLYIMVQCAGAIAGSGLLKAVMPKESTFQENLGLTLLNSKLSPFQGLCIEFILGFMLVLVVFAVSDPNRSIIRAIGPLGVGFTVSAGHLAAVDLTGAAMNPARALGSSVISNNWHYHWIYWLGPITGGILAAIIYVFVFSAPSSEGDYTPVAADEKKGGGKENV